MIAESAGFLVAREDMTAFRFLVGLKENKRVLTSLAVTAVLVLALSAVAQPAGPSGKGKPGAGVLPSGGKKLPPPKIPGLPEPKAEPQQQNQTAVQPTGILVKDDGATRAASVQPMENVDDVVTFKTNFEKDVKCVSLPLNSKISVDFEDAPLYDVLKFMACITERNFLMAANLKQGKTVTILSTTPVTVYEAYRAFVSALDINGMTLIPVGEFYKVIETAKAKTEVVPFYGSNEDVPAEDRLVTRIVVLKHIDQKDVVQVLSKFKTAAGDVTSYAPGNSMIITDLGRNIIRMLKFVKELDIPTGREKIWVRPVQYAAAADMANMITTLFGDKNNQNSAISGGAAKAARAKKPVAQGEATADAIDGPSSVSKVIADERTNQLIIVATPSAYLKIDSLMRRMDVPIEGEGQVHIYYLENANAEEVANTLQSLASGSSGAKRGAKGKGAAGGGAASLFSGEVKITAHKPTNSLVIESTLKDYMALKRVIQQIDVRRKQVYVEAIIMEISTNKDRKLGISGSGGTAFNIDGNTVPMLLGMGGLGISSFDMTQLTKGGMALGLQGPLVDVSTGTTGDSTTSGALSIPSYGFMIQAIQTNSDVNVLSTPHVLTMDNEEAEIVVGKQIPYQATSSGGLSSLLGGYSGLTGSMSGTTNSLMSSGLSSLSGYGGYVQRIDVDLTLKLTPQISESNYVRLKIELQNDDVESMDSTLGPTTSKRKVSNTVVVRDQQPVVIGGLMRDIEISGVDKVPFLGDIPILGLLFRKTDKRVEKRNLLMIITPYIIEDPSDLSRIHAQKMDEMQEFADYMATRKKEYQGGVDYRKKTNLLEDVRQTMDRVRKDREMLEQTRLDDTDTVGPSETHDLEYDPFHTGGEVGDADGIVVKSTGTKPSGADEQENSSEVDFGAVGAPAESGDTPVEAIETPSETGGD